MRAPCASPAAGSIGGRFPRFQARTGKLIGGLHGVLRSERDPRTFIQRKAHNIEAERQCCEIRLRTERKSGELLGQMDRAEKGRPEKTPERTTLSDLGITRDQSSR
jgi:hypothetical protein